MEFIYDIRFGIAIGITFLIFIGAILVMSQKKTATLPMTIDSNLDPGLKKALELIGGDILALLPDNVTKNKSKIAKIERLFKLANDPWKISPLEFIVLQFVLALLGFIAALLLTGVFSYSGVPSLFSMAPLVIIPIVFYKIPEQYHISTASRREIQFKTQLPEGIDYLIMALSGGGYSLSIAFEEVLKYLREGAVKEEFTKVVSDLRTGRTLESALENFAERAPMDNIRAFTKALINANNQSTDMTEILRARAESSRRDLETEIEKRVATLESRITMVFSPTSAISLGIIVIAPVVSTLSQML